MKTLHLILVLIKIANYVVRYTSYGVMTLIFNKKIFLLNLKWKYKFKECCYFK